MTNQSRPLFEVGEMVVLQSKNYPEVDGEYCVLKVMPAQQARHLFPTFIIPNGWIYDIGVVRLGINCGTPCSLFHETDLRKKYPPSSQSFSELMNTLKSPEKA